MRGARWLILTGFLSWPFPGPQGAQGSPDAKVLDLIRSKIERANLKLERALNLVEEGKTQEARSALQDLHVSLEDLKRASGFARQMVSAGEDPLMSGISIVRVRIRTVRVGPEFIVKKSEEIIKREEKREISEKARRWLKTWRGLLTVLPAVAPKWEEVDAEVVQVEVAGKTMRGLLLGPRRRRDLFPGSTIKLERDHDPGRALEVGKEYWMVISVLASHRLPALVFGGGSRSRVYIDEPVSEAVDGKAGASRGRH